MANFSVEWLSKSYYTTQKDTEEEMEAILRDKPPFKDASLSPNAHTDAFLHRDAQEPRNPYCPTSPNNSCGYTSGSESEVGDDSEGEATLQHRRMRTKFTSEQINKLENTFSKHKYLGATQRVKIAEKLNLSETQVKTWFQNRRMKLKREVQEMRPEFLSGPSRLMPPLLFQHPGLGQLPGAFSHSFYPQPLHRLPFPVPPQLPVHQHHVLPVVLPPCYY